MATLNLSNLTNYVNENSGILLKESVNTGRTFEYITIQSGVKYADSLNIMTSELIAIPAVCGAISPTGSVTLSQRTLNVSFVEIPESVCLIDFTSKWTNQLERAGSNQEGMIPTFEELYVADKIEKIAQKAEDLFWRGSPSGTYGTGLTVATGILEILENTSATASVIGATATGALTTATAIDVVDQLIGLIPNDVQNANDLTLFMSEANFRVLMRALRNANYFAGYDGVAGPTWVLENFTNTNVRIVGTRGLVGRNEMILTPASNLYLGTDSFGELVNGDTFKIWYENKDDMVYFRSKFKIGAQVAFPQYVVIKNS